MGKLCIKCAIHEDKVAEEKRPGIALNLEKSNNSNILLLSIVLVAITKKCDTIGNRFA